MGTSLCLRGNGTMSSSPSSPSHSRDVSSAPGGGEAEGWAGDLVGRPSPSGTPQLHDTSGAKCFVLRQAGGLQELSSDRLVENNSRSASTGTSLRCASPESSANAKSGRRRARVAAAGFLRPREDLCPLRGQPATYAPWDPWFLGCRGGLRSSLCGPPGTRRGSRPGVLPPRTHEGG